MAETWHYGLVARWWSEFNLDGPEISYFKKVIQQSGVPALDVGCGTGRILIPCLEAGIYVHGTDISSEIIDYCQAKLDSKNLKTQIEIDGGINFENAKIAKEAGVNIIVSGTTIFKENGGDLKKNIQLLKTG